MRSLSTLVLLLALAGCDTEDKFLLLMTAQVKNTSRPCGPSIQYCVDSEPTTGELTGRLTMSNPPHLFVREGCEGDGEQVGDSVFVFFARAGVGSCYTFNIRVRVDGDRVTGHWGEGSDGHGGGIGGTLVGFKN